MGRIQNIKQRIADSKPVRLAKTTSLPGFEGVPIYNVIVFFFKEIQKETITLRASALAFSFFLAFFPFILFIFTLIPYIPIDNLQQIILTYLEQMMPANAYETIKSTVIDMVSNQRGGLLSFSILVALYFAMNGVSTMLQAFQKKYAAFRKRGFIREQALALTITLVFTSLIILSVGLIMVGQELVTTFLNWLQLEGWITYLALSSVKWGIIIGLLFVAISYLYYVGPATKERWRFVSPGSTLATILVILTSLGFSYYVTNFGRYNKFYGSIGAIIVFMIWLYINALVLLVGFELNTSIAVTRYQKD
jgi:membrane protein